MKCVNFLVLFSFAVVSGVEVQDDLPVLKQLPAVIWYRVGHLLHLECVTVKKSSQKIEYKWEKNGKPLDLTDFIIQNKNKGSIILIHPTVDTEGTYQCFAKTSYGTASSRVVSVKRLLINAPSANSILHANHTPELGMPYKLDCKIPEAYPAPIIEWVKSRSGQTEAFLDQRITVGPDGALYFSNITIEDATRDKYVCRATHPASEKPVVLATHSIQKVLPPSNGAKGELVPQYLSPDMVVKSGDVTMIYCIYGGTPLAHPDWYFGTKNVNNGPKDRVTRHNRTAGKRLLIKFTYLSDQGNYTCKVDNKAGPPQQHTIKLTVVSAPKFFSKPEPIWKVSEGEDVAINCEVRGVPAPKVTRTYNAKPLEIRGKVTIDTNTLIINKVQKNDTGYYGCRAVNSIGDIYTETLLIVV